MAHTATADAEPLRPLLLQRVLARRRRCTSRWRWACTRTARRRRGVLRRARRRRRRRCSRRGGRRPIGATRRRVGPIRVEVVEPLRTLRLLVDAPEHGLRADAAVRAPVAGRSRSRTSSSAPAPRTFFDYTRLTQFGRVDRLGRGRRRRASTSTPDDVVGSRDRSWGIRPVGERAPTGAPVGVRRSSSGCGRRSTSPAFVDPLRRQRVRRRSAVARGRRDRPDGDGDADVTRTVDWRVEWRPGHAVGAAVRVRPDRLGRRGEHRARSSRCTSSR